MPRTRCWERREMDFPSAWHGPKRSARAVGMFEAMGMGQVTCEIAAYYWEKNNPDKTNFDLGYLGVGYTWTFRVSTYNQNQAAKWGFTWVYHDLPSKISEQTTAGIEGAPWCIIRFVWKWAEITWNYHHQCIAMFVKWWMPCFQTNPGGVTTGQLAIGIQPWIWWRYQPFSENVVEI